MLNYAGHGFCIDCVASTARERPAPCSGCNDSAGAAERIGRPRTGCHQHPLCLPPRTPVAKPASPQKHLRLYTEQPPKNVRPQIEAVACLPELLRAFQAATGWTLRYARLGGEPGRGGRGPYRSPTDIRTGFLGWSGKGGRRKRKRREPADSGSRRPIASDLDLPSSNPQSPIPGPVAIARDSARRLAGSIADLLGELLQTRRALWQREAELAAGVPLVPHREEEKHLAARLEAVLRAGAEAVGGDAVALYLLDEATTELKLRCSWGLPFDRLTAPARPLQGAVADLEALLGHAVVLDDDDVMRMWNVPEDFPAAVCVPVSTPTTLLGTLWVFCNEKRDFNDRETNILEVVAGRLASDLEREMLLRAGTDGAETAETGGRRRTAATERTADDRAAAGRLGRGRLDGPGRGRRRGVPRLVLPAQRPAGRGGRQGRRARRRRRVDGQRREDGRPRPRPIPPPGRTHPPASQPYALDRLGRRSTRRAVLRADRDGHRTGVLCVGRPAFRAAAAQRRLAIAQPEFASLWGKAPRPTSSSSDTNFSRARRW